MYFLILYIILCLLGGILPEASSGLQVMDSLVKSSICFCIVFVFLIISWLFSNDRSPFYNGEDFNVLFLSIAH